MFKRSTFYTLTAALTLSACASSYTVPAASSYADLRITGKNLLQVGFDFKKYDTDACLPDAIVDSHTWGKRVGISGLFLPYDWGTEKIPAGKRIKMRAAGARTFDRCLVIVSFVPMPGMSYMAEYTENGYGCAFHIFAVDARGIDQLDSTTRAEPSTSWCDAIH
jgi:hypothetical protein